MIQSAKKLTLATAIVAGLMAGNAQAEPADFTATCLSANSYNNVASLSLFEQGRRILQYTLRNIDAPVSFAQCEQDLIDQIDPAMLHLEPGQSTDVVLRGAGRFSGQQVVVTIQYPDRDLCADGEVWNGFECIPE